MKRHLWKVIGLVLLFALLTGVAVEAAPEMNKSAATLQVGQCLRLKVYHTNRRVSSWESSNTDVATVNRKGTVTAIAPGVATITASLGSTRLQTDITVIPKPALRQTSLTVPAEKTTMVILDGATIASLAIDCPDIATVAEDGTITGLKAGKTKITVCDTDGCTYTAKITVKGWTSKISVKEGKTKTVKPHGYEIASMEITDPTIASVQEGKVQGEKAGTTQLILKGTNGKTYKKAITVTKSYRKVTFDSDGGSEVPTQKVRYNKKATEPEVPVKEGFTFVGWFTDLDETQAYTTGMGQPRLIPAFSPPPITASVWHLDTMIWRSTKKDSI